MPGHLSCVCGAVSIQLHDPIPRFRLECGCCDCRQALQWAQLQGGPTAPCLPDLWYFANDFTFLSGREKTKLFKLRDNGMSIRLVATCCHSTLLVDNPYYNNKVLMVMAQGAKLDVPEIEKNVRAQMKDFPKGRIGELEPFQGKPVDKDNLDDWGKFATSEEFFGAWGAMASDDIENPSGTNFKEITDSSTIEVLGLEHYKELV
eukprot:GFUD01005382.1.p1 GENE.GFUD01005382.1~~GFUD01005382.1.p1  ORF type:complete len:204 (-),score=48.68 GFUD01005382.1:326-937(-)